GRGGPAETELRTAVDADVLDVVIGEPALRLAAEAEGAVSELEAPGAKLAAVLAPDDCVCHARMVGEAAPARIGGNPQRGASRHGCCGTARARGFGGQQGGCNVHEH